MKRRALMSIFVTCFGLAACSEPVKDEHLAFEQYGASVEAALVDGVYNITLKAAEFSVTPHPALFEGDSFDRELGLTIGRETVLRPQVKECQSLIEGPLFEALNRYAISDEPLDTWFLDTPPRGGRFGWHVIRRDDPGMAGEGTFTIKSIVDLKNDQIELLGGGEEIFLISYDFPTTFAQSWRSCDPPAGADTSQGVVDSKRMQFWRLVFE